MNPIFDIVDVKTDENGNYIALIDRFGAEFSLKDSEGKPLFFRKEAIDSFLLKKGENNGKAD